MLHQVGLRDLSHCQSPAGKQASKQTSIAKQGLANQQGSKQANKASATCLQANKQANAIIQLRPIHDLATLATETAIGRVDKEEPPVTHRAVKYSASRRGHPHWRMALWG